MRISNRDLDAALELDRQINCDLESDALDRDHRNFEGSDQEYLDYNDPYDDYLDPFDDWYDDSPMDDPYGDDYYHPDDFWC